LTGGGSDGSTMLGVVLGSALPWTDDMQLPLVRVPNPFCAAVSLQL
jgi:hypothetical protein